VLVCSLVVGATSQFGCRSAGAGADRPAEQTSPGSRAGAASVRAASESAPPPSPSGAQRVEQDGRERRPLVDAQSTLRYQDLSASQLREAERILFALAACCAQLPESGAPRLSSDDFWRDIEDTCMPSADLRWPSKDRLAQRSFVACARSPWTMKRFGGFSDVRVSGTSDEAREWIVAYLRPEILGNTRTPVLFSTGEIRWLTPEGLEALREPELENVGRLLDLLGKGGT
jgi:hypothetical protein